MAYPVVWSVKELAEITDKRRKNKFDAIILVSGGTGTGKTTFLHKFFHKFPDFKIKDKITWKREETISLIKNYKDRETAKNFVKELLNQKNLSYKQKRALSQAYLDLQANLNVRLALEHCFFSLFQ